MMSLILPAARVQLQPHSPYLEQIQGAGSHTTACSVCPIQAIFLLPSQNSRPCFVVLPLTTSWQWK